MRADGRDLLRAMSEAAIGLVLWDRALAQTTIAGTVFTLWSIATPSS